jgi:hypothetical protein
MNSTRMEGTGVMGDTLRSTCSRVRNMDDRSMVVLARVAS